MNSELQDLIRDAHLELRKSAGLLSPEEHEEELHKAAAAKLEGFVLRKLGVRLPILLEYEAVWADKGPIAIFKTDGHVFHLRKDADRDSYPLFLIEGANEREIARIEGSDAPLCQPIPHRYRGCDALRDGRIDLSAAGR